MNKVLWNNEMDLCIGLRTEMDRAEFIEELQATHIDLTGERIEVTSGNITLVDEVIWKFET